MDGRNLSAIATIKPAASLQLELLFTDEDSTEDNSGTHSKINLKKPQIESATCDAFLN